ncbi:hypothetical protein DSO57_1032997 [Entomophthora muscae]|uniref:Uncharacterized protein n=1 Tax=Entomophthora muscae TaxID=34485 RepID=A0ACC2U9Z3_9FUNG|nr:hypothetical protein DSO57_1032997 [Entomophthora muscae]
MSDLIGTPKIKVVLCKYASVFFKKCTGFVRKPGIGWLGKNMARPEDCPSKDQGPELGTIVSNIPIKVMLSTPNSWVEIFSAGVGVSIGQSGHGVKGGVMGTNPGKGVSNEDGLQVVLCIGQVGRVVEKFTGLKGAPGGRYSAWVGLAGWSPEGVVA